MTIETPIRQLLSLVAVSAFAAGCGGDGGPDHQSTTDTQPSQGETPCRTLEVNAVEPFAGNDFLFFRFDQPKGWLHRPSSSGMAGHGWVYSPRNERVQIEYLLNPVPTTADGSVTEMREARMERLEPFDFGGIEVQPFGNSMGRNSTLGLMLPHGDDFYSVVFNFHGPRDCDQSLIESIRSIVLRSLESNPSTKFEN